MHFFFYKIIKTDSFALRRLVMNNSMGIKQKNSVTEGNLLYAFIMFMLPLMAASLLQQSYTITDGLILGNVINQEALGAVSSVSPIIDVCILIQIGVSAGCSIMVSHLFGAEKYADVDRLITDIRRLIIAISVAIALVAIVIASRILRMIHTPDALMAGAATYLRITFAGVPFMALYTLQAGILRGMGDSKRPLGGIAVSSCVNICLDMIFVVIFRTGIAGAAIATVAAEALSAIYLYNKLENKRKTMHLKETDADTECGSGISTEGRKENVEECLRLGAPQIVQSVISSGGKVLLQNITNILGEMVVIGVAVAFKIDSLMLIPLMSMSTAVAVFTGQNTGAGKSDRVSMTLRYGLIFSVSFSLLASLLLWKCGYPLFTLFGLGQEAAETGFRYILLCLPFYWIFGIQFVLNGYLDGSKHTALTSAASVAGLAARLAFAYAAYSHIGADALPLAEALSWVTAVVIDIAGACCLRKKNNRITNIDK